MYLKEIFIENAGPIEELDLSLPLTNEGLPKPVIIVGANGSGKTVLLATIADALVMMATPHYSDIVPQVGLGHAYFKVLGGLSQRVETTHSLSLLGFEHNSQRASYVEKTGIIDQEIDRSVLLTRFPNSDLKDKDNNKTFNGFDKKTIQTICKSSALCFFPSSRRELPHWLNAKAVGERFESEPEFNESIEFVETLGKPIFIERCREQNKRWILDVIFDSRTEIQQIGTQIGISQFENISDRLLLTAARTNIDKILQVILNDPEVRICTNFRSRGSRLAVARRNNIIIPSLNNLSMGQSLLFNVFCTIARYGDRYDLSKGHQLQQIEGVVVIDEVDAHLHTELQFESLPKLIKLFPRVQFIFSTHSPMFLLGMEKEFGGDNIEIFEMPRGELITTERFSEFQKSFDYYTETKIFESVLNTKLLSSQKPTVYMEGETDKDYLVNYLNLIDRTDLIDAIHIDWPGNNDNGTASGGGKNSLDAIGKLFKTKIALLQTKLLLLHDCDTHKKSEEFQGRLFIKSIPLNKANNKIKRGIENLLPESVAQPDFYDEYTDEKGGEHRTINKRRLCDWVTSQNDPNLYIGFEKILQIVEEFADIRKV